MRLVCKSMNFNIHPQDHKIQTKQFMYDEFGDQITRLVSQINHFFCLDIFNGGVWNDTHQNMKIFEYKKSIKMVYNTKIPQMTLKALGFHLYDCNVRTTYWWTEHFPFKIQIIIMNGNVGFFKTGVFNVKKMHYMWLIHENV